MIKYFKTLKEVNYLIKVANQVRAQKPGDVPAWSFFLTNRSFLVPAFGSVLAILIAMDIPALAPLVDYLKAYTPEQLAENVAVFVMALGTIWGVVERMRGKTRVVANLTQAQKAVEEAYAVLDTDKDKLTQALKQAMGK